MKRKIVYGCLLAALIAASLCLLTKLFMPKYMGRIVEGSLIEEYYEDPADHDVIFIGDCEVYENISPVALWEEYGITSYIRGSAQQLIWQSYYLLEDTLRYEKPEVVVFNVLAMQYNEPQKEAYNRMTLDGMRWSSAKYNAIQASMLPDEQLLDYVFPLLRYHSRWSELEEDDFTYLFSKRQVSHNGYYMRVDTKPAGSFPTPKRLTDYQFGSTAYAYLDKMRLLCEENGIQLVLIKAPVLYPHWYEQWDQQMEAYAKEHGLLYLNLIGDIDQIGLDFSKDTYDAGLHLNLSGAEKLSGYLGGILKESCDLTDHREDPRLSAKWEKIASYYEEMKQDQEQELENYGYLKRFAAKEESNN